MLRYFGGKWLLAPWIISHFPAHRVYVEPYGGGASVLLRKPRSYAEIYNDLDAEIVDVFRVIRESGDELRRQLESTPYSRDEFNVAQSGEKVVDRMEQARRVVMRSMMGFGADAVTRGYRTGFRASSNRSGTTPAHDWTNYPKLIPAFQERLSGVVIENRDAMEIMTAHDEDHTLHFVDPPYVHSTRGGSKWGKHGYRHEMTDEQHAQLCDFLLDLRGMVILCGYDNPIYDRLGWQTSKREAHADGARDRIEVLWLNPAAAMAQAQQSLFASAQQDSDAK